eukprot:350819-Chlamydomonas_euryale.AAC.3
MVMSMMSLQHPHIDRYGSNHPPFESVNLGSGPSPRVADGPDCTFGGAAEQPLFPGAKPTQRNFERRTRVTR